MAFINIPAVAKFWVGPDVLPPGPPGSQWPNLANFTKWVQVVMGVPPAYLDPNSPILFYVFAEAYNIVNQQLGFAYATPGAWSVYELATYNLGGHLLIEFAPDISYQIEAAAYNNGQVQLTTADLNLVSPGDQIVVSGISPNPYNSSPGTQFQVYSILDQQNFTYPLINPTGQAMGAPFPNPGPATIPPAGATVSEWYWGAARQQFNITSTQFGIVTHATDLSTSAGLMLPNFLSNLTLGDLQLIKTPYGARYLSFAQKTGTIWGLT